MQRKYELFTKDIREYLCAKLPDISIPTLEEIAAYVGNRSAILVFDAVEDRDSQWRKSLKQQYRHAKREESSNDQT